jgi:aspartate/methionine/tyrosine aminotransferase
MVPIPQYPLYTATLSVLDARVVPYYLDEENAWGTSMEAIRTAYDKAVAEGTDVKAICVINPGNPTGASLPAEDIKGVLKFAAEKGLVVVADEVYQTNVFIGEFVSFKKALRDLQKAEPGKYDDIELASLHSTSKGMVGECGHRGGYFELIGFDPEVAAEVYKFISIQLCPPVLGQCIVEMMVNPPKEGEESYALYREEYDTIFAGLKKRAYALYEAFKKMEGVKCDEPQVRIHFLFLLPLTHITTTLLTPHSRAQCTSSPPSTSHPKPSNKPNRKAASPTNSTASVCSTQQVYALLLARASGRKKARCILGRRFWRPVRSGRRGWLASMRGL